jgi:hypothetical protein
LSRTYSEVRSIHLKDDMSSLHSHNSDQPVCDSDRLDLSTETIVDRRRLTILVTTTTTAT